MTWEFIKFKPSNYEFIKDCLQTAVLGKKKFLTNSNQIHFLKLWIKNL